MSEAKRRGPIVGPSLRAEIGRLSDGREVVSIGISSPSGLAEAYSFMRKHSVGARDLQAKKSGGRIRGDRVRAQAAALRERIALWASDYRRRNPTVSKKRLLIDLGLWFDEQPGDSPAERTLRRHVEALGIK